MKAASGSAPRSENSPPHSSLLTIPIRLRAIRQQRLGKGSALSMIRWSQYAAMRQFERYIGIDYSGAATPFSSLSGLRIYAAGGSGVPEEIGPPPSPRKYWTRRGIAEWLVAEIRSGPPTLVGIDHAFSFPLRYFEVHRLAPDWPSFLDDFHRHWPTDEANTYVDFVRDGVCGDGASREGNSRWRRLAEDRCRAKSVFHFDAQGCVGKSTHAGLPWLLHIRRQLGDCVHFWPFDGWTPPTGKSVIAEIYPALWNRAAPTEGRNSHQQDAYSAALWMQQGDSAGTLTAYMDPSLPPAQKTVAGIEGWILGLA